MIKYFFLLLVKVFPSGFNIIVKLIYDLCEITSKQFMSSFHIDLA